MTDSEYWERYYKVTVDRPAWETVRLAIDKFRDEDAGRGMDRLAVDLGCGAGRDTRELLRAGWHVLAVDREPAAIAALEEHTLADQRLALETLVADLATVEIPACDLVNANVSLPFLVPDTYWATWRRAQDALRAGGRIAAMLYLDRDDLIAEVGTTCPSPDAIRASLDGFEIEHWTEREEDSQTALGEPHHLHMVELVARKAS